MPDVLLNGVSKNYGNIEAIDRVDLDVKDKEYFCVLGPTGSGKTTLLRLISGLIKPDKGEITFNGTVVNRLKPQERNISYMPQHYILFPHMTVLQNVMFAPLSKGVVAEEAMERAHKVLDMVNLDHRSTAYSHELSGGMQQRIALARALASDAKLLLLDEPMGSLDARLRQELRYKLKSLAKRLNLTVIHVTHDQKETMIVADRIVVLREGRVEQIGSPYHIYLQPTNLFVANFVGETNFLEGTIDEVDSTGSFVKLYDKCKVRVSDTSYLLKEQVILAVKEEHVKVETNPSNEINSFSGKVKAIRFLGNFIKIEIQIVNKILLRAKFPSPYSNSRFKLHQKVWISFHPSDATVFSNPPRGLYREIEVK